VAGPAVGAGFQLALACDLRLAAADAAFRMAETSLGLVPDLAGTGPLVRAVGEQAALEICLTGRTVGAEEALRLGLVRAVVGADELEQATDDLVGAVLASPEAAVRETLDLLRGAGGRAPEEQQRREREAQSRLLAARAAPAVARPHGGAEGAGPARR
jgi:enoyl-CoA hydratase/carnithine racemase